MTELFQAERHTALRDAAWSEDEARAAIREIADDALGAFDPEKLWPPHPQDDIPLTLASLYLGASGVAWALDYLKRERAISAGRDFAPVLDRLITHDSAWLGAIPMGRNASLLMSDLGPMLLAMRLRPDAALADRIHARLSDNNDLPLLELMWGTPGSMLACLFMHTMTGDVRFAELFRTQAARLLGALDDAGGFRLWTVPLYGTTMRGLGPVHGFAGHMLALLRGWDWLDGEAQRLVENTAQQTLAATAIRHEGLANWPVDLNRPEQPPLCQVCHGAPGILLAFADAPFGSPAFERLLLEGGELVWKAGPLAKGSNLCHGTGGNGYAFLKLYRRTGNPLWLERARAFAMTAMAQVRAARAEYGRGRHTLWTGDPGLAVYLWDCVRAKPAFPTLDVL
jgi:hypothetical protein